MPQLNYPDGTTAYIRSSTALNKLFNSSGELFGTKISVVDSSGTETQIASSTGLLYSEGKPVRFESNYLGSASTSVDIPNYGLSAVNASTGVAKNKYTLAAPDIGVEKTIYAVTVNTTDIPVVYSGSTAIVFRDGSTGAEKLYIEFNTKYASVNLVGISTSRWLVTSYVGDVSFSTST